MASTEGSSSLYDLKEIRWNGRRIKIVTQNKNGPCPLLAIANLLLLRDKIKIHPDLSYVSYEHLVSLIGDLLVSSIPDKAAEEIKLNMQQNMADAMSVIPRLQTGLDVNVGFTGITDFEYTPECIIFDLLGIKLTHGWVADPTQLETFQVVQFLKYNTLVEKVINQAGQPQKDDTASKELVEALIGRNFLEENASQLTYQGIFELNQKLKDGELVVFFRNNHFSTLLKRKDELFLLLTDQGFKKEEVVWETLSNVEGDGTFVTSDFLTFRPTPIPPPTSQPTELDVNQDSGESHFDADLQIAKQLQAEADQELAAEQQRKFNMEATSTMPMKSSGSSGSQGRRSEENRGDSSIRSPSSSSSSSSSSSNPPLDCSIL